ncbi:MAG: DEAD/DEAH box helicase [Bdellovibrionaceae bacterium]|nr:DEAD/DEAH box helicase [Pseudobdellovibrionaceae bacterium]
MSTFEDLGLSPELIKHLETIGFVAPTEIQTKAIPILLKHTGDFIGLAATGTGKTAAFGLPMIEHLDTSKKYPQALILSPTRELALQIVEQLKTLSSYKKMKIAAIYGGASYRTQIEDVRRGAHVIVATPGRLIDLLDQGVFHIRELSTLVLDEADEMISMGFRDSLEEILEQTHAEKKTKAADNDDELDDDLNEKPKKRRAGCKTWLFSATMSPAIKKITSLYLTDPTLVEVQRKGNLSEQITQLYFTVKEDLKLKALTHLLDALTDFYGIIFCETKIKCAQIEQELNKKGYQVESLHGDKSQKEREWTLKRFKNQDVKVIVATDVAARGLDISDLTHVVNFHLPWDVESYVHRIGRTGRNGKTGFSYTLVSPRELSLLKAIHQKTKANLIKGTIPTSAEVVTHKLKSAGEKLVNAKVTFTPTMKENFKASTEFQTLNDLTKEELIFKLLSSKVDAVQEHEVPFDFLNGRVPREMDPNFRPQRGQRMDSRPAHLRGERRRERSNAVHFAKERFDRNKTGEERSERSEYAPRREGRYEGRSDSRSESRAPKREGRDGDFAPRARVGGIKRFNDKNSDRMSSSPRKTRTFE